MHMQLEDIRDIVENPADLSASTISMTEIEAREEAAIEWFPGDWTICTTTG